MKRENHDLYHFIYGDKYMKLKVENFNADDKFTLKTLLSINNTGIYVKSVFHDSEYSYHWQVFQEKKKKKRV